jgi:hypothetical protein
MGRDRDPGRVRPVEPNGQTAQPETHDPRTRESIPATPRRHDADHVVDRRDSARWGPIWAGLITALTTFLLLELLATGLGLQDVGADNDGDGLVSGIIGLIAFFTGGWVAGITSAVRGAGTGLLNGLLVWGLGTVLILVLSALGLGQIFGALGNLVGQLGLVQGGMFLVPSANVDPEQVAQAIRDAALGTFFGLLFSALASALGGWLGGKRPDPIGYMVDD